MGLFVEISRWGYVGRHGVGVDGALMNDAPVAWDAAVVLNEVATEPGLLVLEPVGAGFTLPLFPYSLCMSLRGGVAPSLYLIGLPEDTRSNGSETKARRSFL